MSVNDFEVDEVKEEGQLDFMEDVQLSDEDKGTVILNGLQTLVVSYDQLKERIKSEESYLKELKEQFNSIAQHGIPDYLDEFGLSGITLSDKRKIKVEKDVSVSVKDQDAFFNFLRSRKDDAIIKDTITIENPESKTKTLLLENHIVYDSEKKVHSQTLKKYFRDLIELGDTPPECVSVYIYNKTKIK